MHIVVDPSIKVALVWLITLTLLSPWKQRRDGIVRSARTRAQLEASSHYSEWLRSETGISNGHVNIHNLVTAMMIPLGTPGDD